MPELSRLSSPDAPSSAPPQQAFGHIASAVMHSVINHISAIVSQAEMLKARRPGGEEMIDRADAIIRSALVGSAMARRLSEYSRTLSNSDLVDVDLDALIAERVRARRASAPPGVELKADLVARCVFPGDSARLELMLDCLIDNAFEALADGRRRGGLVVVSTRIDSRGWLELDVRDDGPGMTPDVLEYALEPFFSTKDDHAGIGLPLARSLWRRHRGAFSIDAPEGKGTRVRLTRPVTPTPPHPLS